MVGTSFPGVPYRAPVGATGCRPRQLVIAGWPRPARLGFAWAGLASAGLASVWLAFLRISVDFGLDLAGFS